MLVAMESGASTSFHKVASCWWPRSWVDWRVVRTLERVSVVMCCRSCASRWMQWSEKELRFSRVSIKFACCDWLKILICDQSESLNYDSNLNKIKGAFLLINLNLYKISLKIFSTNRLNSCVHFVHPWLQCKHKKLFKIIKNKTAVYK